MEKTTLRHIIIKLLNINDKDKILKATEKYTEDNEDETDSQTLHKPEDMK